jgi:hypothetical protein
MFNSTHQNRTWQNSAPRAEAIDTETPGGMYREHCHKCRGRGRFIGYSGRDFGKCFACGGVGYKEFRHSADDRAKARASTAARKAKSEQENYEIFAAAYPVVWAWINEARPTFEFASAMHEAVRRYGELTDRQLAACERCVAKRAEAKAKRDAEQAVRAESAPAVNLDKLMAAFDHANRAGLKRPKLRFDGFQCSLPKADSKNAGGVYVKDGSTYLGKIVGGKFFRSRDCDAGQEAAVAEAMADPLKAAVSYGRKTGSCSCCGRGLIDPVSVEHGIGPICADKFGLVRPNRKEVNERNRREVAEAVRDAEIEPTLISGAFVSI